MSTQEVIKMLRGVLDRQQHSGLVETMENTSTPLRGGNVGNPRTRLMDKHTKLAQIPLYTLPPSRPVPGVTSVVRDKVAARRPATWLPSRVHQRQACQADRFIPQRRHKNVAASNYILTKVPPRAENSYEIDVFEQLSNLDITWRKKLMKSALEKSMLLPSAGQQRVLNISQPLGANRENYRTAKRTIDDNPTDGVWKTRARDKPLIGLTDIIADVPTRTNWRRGLLDWSATDFIAAIIGTAIVIFDGRSKIAIARPGRVLSEITARIHAIKWNNAGTMIAICTVASEIIIYHFEPQKLLWRRECRCTIESPEDTCEVLCVAWTHNDAQIVIGCTEGRISSYNALEGTMIDTIFAHTDMILAIAFSPNDRYLVSSGMDKAVRIHTWPNLTPHLAIGYYEPVQAMAWHPWEVDMLCVGGGFEDGSLSLWNIHRQESLGFRKVPFLGVIKNMAWNKLSGELVVQWNYQLEDTVSAVVPVLASLDRIVDVVTTVPRIMDIVWNPNGTQLAMRLKNYVKVWNFFGNETSNWYNENEKNRLSKEKRNTSSGRTSNLEKYTIR